MCIAIYKPADKELTKETLKICFDANSDGAGFAYINTDYVGHKKIKIKKTLDFEDFYQKYERALRIAPESPFLIHFRIKTHGEVSTFNCHPFKIDDETVFMHNGIISGVGTDIRKSDTQLFNEKILMGLEDGWMFNSSQRLLIEDFIGHSKLVVLNLNGDVQIFNEGKGKWDGGIWYSNESYKPKSYSYNYSNKSNYSTYKGSTNKSIGTTNKNVQKLITSRSWLECDECGHWHCIDEMNQYCIEDDVVTLCPTCTVQAMTELKVYPSDKISMTNYIAFKNSERWMDDKYSPVPKGAVIEDWSTPYSDDVDQDILDCYGIYN